MNKLNNALLIAAILSGSTSCSTLSKIFALDQSTNAATAPIQNPFEDGSGNTTRENIILRTKKGNQSVEIEIPGSTAHMSDFVVPISPAFKDEEGGRRPASYLSESDPTFPRNIPPTLSDREITQSLPAAMPENAQQKREIEEALGVTVTEDQAVNRDQSYLSTLDQVKQLYRLSRFEAALLELDGMIRVYPTDPKLHEMRGTLLDRLGKSDLALKSWNQALRFNPNNVALKKFIERKQSQRRVASP